MTSFGSRLDIIPHFLGYDDEVIEILETSASPIVLSAVLVALCIYLVILVWARNKDTEEIGKVSTPLVFAGEKDGELNKT